MANVKLLSSFLVVIATLTINFQALVVADDTDIYTLSPPGPVTSTGPFVPVIDPASIYTFSPPGPVTSTAPFVPAIPPSKLTSHDQSDSQPSPSSTSPTSVSDTQASTEPATTASTKSSTGTSMAITSTPVTTLAASTRPPQSGFWTGSDPFSHVRPSTWTTPSDTTNSDEATSTMADSSTSSSSTNSSSVNSTPAKSNTTTKVSALSTSISYAVTYVTASPTEPTLGALSTTQVPTTTPQFQGQSSKGSVNIIVIEPWLVVAAVVMIHELF